MSLLNPALIFGLVFAAIPVILHLMMRARPKRMIFPALQLIQKRRRQNVRRIRLRHLWLLLLRVFVLAVLVAALMRPSLPAAEYGLNLREALTTVAIAAVCFGAYWGVMRHWRRRKVANHVIASRRTSLRAGLGVAAATLFGVLVVWPYQQRVAAEITAPLPEVSPDVPVAAVFLFDTSLSMEYRLEGRTRLDEASDLALEHLSALPAQSRIAVADTSSSSAVLFQADSAGAQTRIEALETSARAVPLNDRLRAAVKLQEEDRDRTLSSQGDTPESLRSDRLVREVYVFTDLARSAWNTASGKFLRDELERLSWVSVYLIDVGVESPRNIALAGLSLSSQEVAVDGQVVIEASVQSVGLDGNDVTVEFYSGSVGGEPVKQGQRTVKLSGDSSQPLPFTAEANDGNAISGELRLLTSDPLASDNRLYFTVGTRPPIRVLVSAPAKGDSDRDIEASSAYGLVTLLRALQFDVQFVPAHELKSASLTTIDLVVLVNVPAPATDTWSRLEQFVQAGGGLLGILGSESFDAVVGIDAVAWGVAEAIDLLPGKLDVVRRFRPVAGLDVKDTEHPILQEFNLPGVAADVALIPVWKAWNVEPAADARIPARFTDERSTPAILERAHGRGRVAVFTTAGHLEFDDRKQWSRLAGEWPFLILVNRMALYLSGRTDARFNFSAIETVSLHRDRENPARAFLLQRPSGAQVPTEIAADAESILIDDAFEVGHYRLKSVGGVPDAAGSVVYFSVNQTPEESDFTRSTEADLTNLLGEDRFSVAQNIESLTRSVKTGRLGVEIFPLALGLLLILFCLELLTANRFYEADQESAPVE